MRAADRGAAVTARHAASYVRGLATLWCAGLAILLAAAVGSSKAGAATPLEPSSPTADSTSLAPDDSLATPDVDETELPPTAPDSEGAGPTAVPLKAAATARPPSGAVLNVIRKVRLTGASRNVLRSGPSERFSIVGVYEKDTSFPVIAKREGWYGVQLSDTETGWVDSTLCKEFDDLSDLEFSPNPKLYSRTGSYVLLGYTGGYAFDRKSNSLVIGGRLGYYVFDRLQVEAGVAWTHVHRPAEIVESLFDLSLEAEDFHMVFYALNVTWELLPGRQMVPFVSGGVGSSIMQGDVEASVNLGAGTTLFLSKRTAMRWEVRDYRFSSGPADARRSNNNIEFTLGTQLLF